MGHTHTMSASAPASVVLDIGGDVGALAVYTGPEQHGLEIEVSPVGTDGAPDPAAVRTHAAVRLRALRPTPLYGALIPDLAAGRYAVWDGDDALSTVDIVGGRVAEYGWPVE
jgi:hypothetical protein